MWPDRLMTFRPSNITTTVGTRVINEQGGKKAKKMRHLFLPLAFGDVKKRIIFTTEKGWNFFYPQDIRTMMYRDKKRIPDFNRIVWKTLRTEAYRIRWWNTHGNRILIYLGPLRTHTWVSTLNFYKNTANFLENSLTENLCGKSTKKLWVLFLKKRNHVQTMCTIRSSILKLFFRVRVLMNFLKRITKTYG